MKNWLTQLISKKNTQNQPPKENSLSSATPLTDESTLPDTPLPSATSTPSNASLPRSPNDYAETLGIALITGNEHTVSSTLAKIKALDPKAKHATIVIVLTEFLMRYQLERMPNTRVPAISAETAMRHLLDVLAKNDLSFLKSFLTQGKKDFSDQQLTLLANLINDHQLLTTLFPEDASFSVSVSNAIEVQNQHLQAQKGTDAAKPLIDAALSGDRKNISNALKALVVTASDNNAFIPSGVLAAATHSLVNQYAENTINGKDARRAAHAFQELFQVLSEKHASSFEALFSPPSILTESCLDTLSTALKSSNNAVSDAFSLTLKERIESLSASYDSSIVPSEKDVALTIINMTNAWKAKEALQAPHVTASATELALEVLFARMEEPHTADYEEALHLLFAAYSEKFPTRAPEFLADYINELKNEAGINALSCKTRIQQPYFKVWSYIEEVAALPKKPLLSPPYSHEVIPTAGTPSKSTKKPKPHSIADADIEATIRSAKKHLSIALHTPSPSTVDKLFNALITYCNASLSKEVPYMVFAALVIESIEASHGKNYRLERTQEFFTFQKALQTYCHYLLPSLNVQDFEANAAILDTFNHVTDDSLSSSVDVEKNKKPPHGKTSEGSLGRKDRLEQALSGCVKQTDTGLSIDVTRIDAKLLKYKEQHTDKQLQKQKEYFPDKENFKPKTVVSEILRQKKEGPSSGEEKRSSPILPPH